MNFSSNISIFSKTLGSFSILILGYLLTMIFFGVTTKSIETSLATSSDTFVPAVKQSQATLAYFDKELKLLQDAVIMGEVESVQEAGNIAILVI